MKVKKMLSALLAAAMMCSLLCLPAFAAEKDDILKALNGADVWVDVKDTSGLEDVVTMKLRGWDYDEGTSSWVMADALDETAYAVTKLPLGVTISVGPDNAMVGGVIAYTAGQDGVFVQRMERVTQNGEKYVHEVLPLGTTGALKETGTVEYFWYFDWGWGTNNLLYSEYNGYRSLTTDYLVEQFGANTLIAFMSPDGELGSTLYLLTGEKRPASLTSNSLADHGIYMAKTGDLVSSWAVDPVNAAYDAGLIYYPVEESHNFDLTGNVTRAEFAAIAMSLYYTMSGKDSVNIYDIPFTDLDENSDFYKKILAAYELGIVTGKTETRFAPDDLVTREQAAAMLARVYEAVGGKIPAVTATSFADNADIAGYARDAVAFMAGREIISGVGSNRFNPTGSATVEQALKIAVSMLETLG